MQRGEPNQVLKSDLQNGSYRGKDWKNYRFCERIYKPRECSAYDMGRYVINARKKNSLDKLKLHQEGS